MANYTGHRFQESMYNLEKFPVVLYGYATNSDYSAISNASYDISNANLSLGLNGIFYTATGKFKIALKKPYASLLSYTVCSSVNSNCMSWEISNNQVSNTTTPFLELTATTDNAAGNASDPANNATLYIKLELRNSSVG